MKKKRAKRSSAMWEGHRNKEDDKDKKEERKIRLRGRVTCTTCTTTEQWKKNTERKDGNR